MASLDAKSPAAQWLLQPPMALLFAGGITLLTAATYLWPSNAKNAPALPEAIPYVSNTYQYMTDMKSFLQRAAQALSLKHIVQLHLGPMKIYLLTGARNVQVMFRASTSVSADKFMIMVFDNVSGVTKGDLAKFVGDRSGRLATPAPGTEETPENQRYWLGLHHVVQNNLARTAETNKLAEAYQRLFAERLEKYPVGEWTTARVFEFMREDMAVAAIISLTGPRILELSPDLLDILWEFDEIAASLVWGLPKWLNRKGYEKRDRFRATCGKFLEAAWANFDWDGPDADADWEPNFGSRFTRELAKWMKRSEFEPQTSAGILATTAIFGLNSNTIPVTTWAVMEVAKDPSLLQAVREEVMTAYVTDPTTSKRTIDPQKLLSLPLLQSIYVEALRLHVSINITREVREPIVVEGYKLEKGSILQAPSEIAHYDESIWSAKGHPASEFWAARHIKYVEETDGAGKVTPVPQFSMAGRSSDFIPYGGGISMCPGRFFAKQEIMITIAVLVSRFDIEFVEWTTLDGGPSDRPAENDVRWSGGAAVPPDRDMKVQWKRLW